VQVDGATPVTYTAGDKMYASQNGLLTNASGLLGGVTNATVMGILLAKPTATDAYMSVQLRV
jgi:hypothetical protein